MLGRGNVLAQVAIISKMLFVYNYSFSISCKQMNTLIVNSRGPLFLPFFSIPVKQFFALGTDFVALLRGLRASKSHRDFGVSL